MPRKCRVYTALDPSAQWAWSETLANKANYLLELIVWQNSTPYEKSKLEAHKRKKPQPFVPDFMKPSSEMSKEVDAMTVDDVKSWLSVPRG